MAIRIIWTLLLLTLVSAAFAEDESASLRKALEAQLPGARIGAITKTPYGLYEIVVNGSEVIYTDEKATVVFQGRLIDLKSRTDLTAKRLEELRHVDFSQLPLDKAIVKVKGSGARKLAVFSDPDCPFCKKLEPELEGITDVTIYTFLFPIPSLHPDAMRKATLIWCAPDRVKAWDDQMLRGQAPQKSNLSCATPILEIQQLADQLGIAGTPGLVFQNGKLVPGLITRDQIEVNLKAASS